MSPPGPAQMLRFPSPARPRVKEAHGGTGGRPRWTVYLSICLLMPALAAMIGIVAWAISIEVATENTASLLAASKQHLQRHHLQQQQQQQQQHHSKLSYLHLKRPGGQEAPAQPPVASAVVAAAATSGAGAEASAANEPLLSAGKRRRVLPTPAAGASSGESSGEAEEDGDATVLLTNIDQLAGAEYSAGQSDSNEKPAPEIMSAAWSPPKGAKRKAAQAARKLTRPPLPGAEEASMQVDENNKALMKKLESAVSAAKLAASKQQQVLIKHQQQQAERLVVAAPLVAPEAAQSADAAAAAAAAAADALPASGEAEAEPEEPLHAKSDALIDYRASSAGSGSPAQPQEARDELANNGAADSESEELGYAAIASAISTAVASSSSAAAAADQQQHRPHLVGDTGREARVSAIWNEAGEQQPPSAGQNVAQVIDHLVERRKQASNSLRIPQIVVVAPVGQSAMRAQSLTLEQEAPLPPVSIDRRISSTAADDSSPTGVQRAPVRKSAANVRVKRNRPIGARLLGTGSIEEASSVNRRLDGPQPLAGHLAGRFSERIQVIEEDDSSALIGGPTQAAPLSQQQQQRPQERSPQRPEEAAFSRQPRHQPPQVPANGNKVYLAEQVVREHVLRAQQRADKASHGSNSLAAAAAHKRAAVHKPPPPVAAPPMAMAEAESALAPAAVKLSSAAAAPEAAPAPEVAHYQPVEPEQQLQQQQQASGFPAPQLAPNQLADQEFQVPAHLADSLIRQIERAPVELYGAGPYAAASHQFPLQTPYVPQYHQQQQQQHYQHPQQLHQAPATMYSHPQQQQQQLYRPAQRMQQQQPGNLEAAASISTRAAAAAGPQATLRNWLSSLRGHRQPAAQSRMPEPGPFGSPTEASQPSTLEAGPTKGASLGAQQQQQSVENPQEVQEVQDSYEQMSYQMPPSYGPSPSYGNHRPHYGGAGGGDDNEKKSKGLTFHFGGGPIGGGSQLITSPMGIFKHLMIPLLPNPRVNLNGKVVFGVVLEKSTAFGEPKKKFKFWG